MQFKLSPLMAALAVAASAAFVPAVAQAQLSFNIGVVSLYKSSGVDQDDKQKDAATAKNFRPALQGGVDYSFGNGFYVGNWNSTGKFGNGDGVEIDLYAGYGGEITKGLSYDLNLTTYIYPGADDGYDGTEFATTLTYGMFSARYVYGFGDDYTNKWVYGVRVPVSDALSVSAHYHDKVASGQRALVLGASYDLGDGLSASATVSGASGNGVDAKNRLVLGLSKSF